MLLIFTNDCYCRINWIGQLIFDGVLNGLECKFFRAYFSFSDEFVDNPKFDQILTARLSVKSVQFNIYFGDFIIKK